MGLSLCEGQVLLHTSGFPVFPLDASHSPGDWMALSVQLWEFPKAAQGMLFQVQAHCCPRELDACSQHLDCLVPYLF